MRLVEVSVLGSTEVARIARCDFGNKVRVVDIGFSDDCVWVHCVSILIIVLASELVIILRIVLCIVVNLAVVLAIILAI